ncbi:hypothetical protein Patl1_37187 [Pistacia atlantica]|nr:hypothetical protein Patl1_37187 [Pistacia atlantica]
MSLISPEDGGGNVDTQQWVMSTVPSSRRRRTTTTITCMPGDCCALATRFLNPTMAKVEIPMNEHLYVLSFVLLDSTTEADWEEKRGRELIPLLQKAVFGCCATPILDDHVLPMGLLDAVVFGGILGMSLGGLGTRNERIKAFLKENEDLRTQVQRMEGAINVLQKERSWLECHLESHQVTSFLFLFCLCFTYRYPSAKVSCCWLELRSRLEFLGVLLEGFRRQLLVFRSLTSTRHRVTQRWFHQMANSSNQVIGTVRVEGGDSNKGIIPVIARVPTSRPFSSLPKDELVQVHEDYGLSIELKVIDGCSPKSRPNG